MSVHHFEVHGQCRDYDYAEFCEKHAAEADDFARDWLSEAFDGCDVGEARSVEVRVVAGEIDADGYCVECKSAIRATIDGGR